MASPLWDPGQDWIQIFDKLLKHPQGPVRGCRCDMCQAGEERLQEGLSGGGQLVTDEMSSVFGILLFICRKVNVSATLGFIFNVLKEKPKSRGYCFLLFSSSK